MHPPLTHFTSPDFWSYYRRLPPDIQITTGTFTAEAQREAARDGAPPIKLVDGMALIGMLEKLEIGLKPVQTYTPDFAFFEEFQKKKEDA